MRFKKVGPRENQGVFELQCVLLADIAELLREIHTSVEMFRTQKVVRTLDGAMVIEHLVSAACWNENGVTRVLINAPAFDTVLSFKARQEPIVQIKPLIMDWIPPDLDILLLGDFVNKLLEFW